MVKALELILRQWCPQFSQSSVNDHPVSHMMTRMFSTVMILLGLIQYSLVRYCTTLSSTADNRSTKEHMLKIFVMCMATADMIHTFSFSNYQLRYGSLLDLSSFVNIFGSISLFIGRILFLWLNYPNKKKKTQ